MQIKKLTLDGLQLIIPDLFRDDRGLFLESYQQERYAKYGVSLAFVQDNCSISHRGTIRALHFQPGQSKLISCVYGSILDVAVDIRRDSPTFKMWEGAFLNDSNQHQLFIPDGFAHGFCVLSDLAVVTYKTSAYYDPMRESSIRWNDPDLAIQWPTEKPTLSARDQSSPFFKELIL